jgi:3-oxoacyl-[acyl-carrier protein] reductase
MRLKDKVAIVTGAASGFGKGIAEEYAAQGAKVVVADINEAGARDVAKAVGGVPVGGDIATEAGNQAAVEAALRHFGGLDIVVANAGWTFRNKPILDVTEEEFDRVFAINVKSIYWMVRAAVPVWRRQGRGGSLINIASTAGIRPRPGLTWYNATKGAVNTATLAMAQEFARDNIRVNAICPVIGQTGLTAEFMGAENTPENAARFIATIPLGRMSTPADIANACVWLAEDRSSFITGVLLPVDGGRCA